MNHRAMLQTEPDFKVAFDAEMACVTMTWRGYHTSAAFREYNERVLNEVGVRRAAKMLCDIRYFVLIGATDQDWLNVNWLPRAIEAGLHRCAIVIPVFYFNRVAVETVVDRIDALALSVASFNSIGPARAWLSNA